MAYTGWHVSSFNFTNSYKWDFLMECDLDNTIRHFVLFGGYSKSSYDETQLGCANLLLLYTYLFKYWCSLTFGNTISFRKEIQ